MRRSIARVMRTRHSLLVLPLLVLAAASTHTLLARGPSSGAGDAASQAAQPGPASPFDRHFTGRTMRVDYFHTGKADARLLSLDRVVDDGPWPGSRTRLLDDTNLGQFRVEVIDRATNAVIYTRGFASIYGEWETTPEAKTEWRTFHDSVRFPWPKTPVQVVVKRRQPDQSFREIWSTAIDPESRFVNRAPPVPAGTLTVLAEHGAPERHVDLLFVAEGYTASQGADAVADARRLVAALFREEPYKSRERDFNVRVLHVPSATAGVHRPQAASPRRTPVSAEYNIFDSERYLLTLDNRALRETAASAPYDAVVVLVNETQYGGGGVFNAHATVAARNEFADYLFVHEFAHHFAALADEYYTSDVAYETGLTGRPEPWEPNITALTHAAALKWRDLVDAATPVPTPWHKEAFDARAAEYQATRRALRGRNAPEAELSALFRAQQAWEREFFAALPHAGRVGAYEGAGYETKGLYRPEQDCLMFSRNPVGFCRVCRRAIDRVIDLHVR
jgi:hypothetical protein